MNDQTITLAPTVSTVGSILLIIGYWAVFTVSIVWSIIFVLFVIPSFRETFSSFGADNLPILTTVVFENRFVFLIVPVVSFAAALFISMKHPVNRNVFIKYLVGLGAVFILCFASFVIEILAAYLPIFQLGSVV